MNVKLFLLGFFLFTSLTHAGPTYDMGKSGTDGTMQMIDQWNNDAMAFGSQAEEWKKKYPIQKLRRLPDGNTTEETVLFCANGKKVGLALIQNGNNTSLKYEAYLAQKPGDPNVVPAYTNHDRNLKLLHRQLMDDNAAAKCGEGN